MSQTPVPGAVDLLTHTFPVRWQDALDKARSKFADDVSKIELEDEQGRYAYKVGSERHQKRVDLGQVVTLKEAMDAARQARSGPIGKWKIEGKSTGAQYEFDIHKGGPGSGDYEVQVDAKNGKVASPGS